MSVSPDLAGFARALAEVIAASGLTRRQVADRAGAGCSETTLTNWLAARGKPDYEAVFRVEEALMLPAGALSRYLGFRPVEGEAVNTVEAIVADPSLSSEARSALLALYRVLSGERSS